MQAFFEKLARVLIERPKTVIAGVMLVTVGGALGLPNIEIKMGNDVFVSEKSAVYQETEAYKKAFGGDNVYVFVEQKSKNLITHETFQAIHKFEKQVRKAEHVTKTTSIVSLLNEELQQSGASQLGNQDTLSTSEKTKLQRDIQANLSTADKKALQEKTSKLLTPTQQTQLADYTQSLLTTDQVQVLVQKGGSAAVVQTLLTAAQKVKVQAYMQGLLTTQQQAQVTAETMKRLPTVENMSTALLQDLLMKNGTVHKSVADLLPNNGKSLLLMASLDDTDMDTFTEATSSLKKVIQTTDLGNLKVRLAGQPVVMGEITGEVAKTMAIMLAISVALMVLILAFIFPVRRRLLALVFVLIGLIWAFGIMGWLHIALTLATMATLPILIGLGTDFGVQFQNRYEEEYRKSGNHKQAIEKALGAMGPAVGTALIVMIFAFLTMYLSKAPMMQQFGLTLAIGVVAVYTVELLLMFATLAICDRNNPVLADHHTKQSLIGRALKWYALGVTKHAKWVLLVGLLLGGAGFYVEHNIPIETDMLKMIPQDMQALKDTKYLQKQVGSTTYITYFVQAEDVTQKTTLREVDAFAQAENKKYAEVLDATTLLSTYESLNGTTQLGSQTSVTSGIKQLPSAVKSSLINPQQTATQIQFKLNSELTTAEQNKLMKQITKDSKKYGFKTIKRIVPAGSQVLMLTAIDNMSANREWMMVAGLIAIVVVLFAVYRKVQYALLPALPIIAVLGLSPLTLYALQTSYNPLTLGLSALVLGIGTEFTILILERYREEVERGVPVQQAVVDAVQSVGQAITVSGLTVVGGFAAIIGVSFPVLSSFGLITVLDTAYSLLAALTLLPAIIVLTQKDRTKKDAAS